MSSDAPSESDLRRRLEELLARQLPLATKAQTVLEQAGHSVPDPASPEGLVALVRTQLGLAWVKPDESIDKD